MKTIKVSKKKMKTVDLREVAVDKIRAHVKSMCDYAIANQCVEQSQFEELDWMLMRLPRG